MPPSEQVAVRIPLSSPDITQLEIDAVMSVLRTTRLSLGPQLPLFEQAIANYIGVPYATAVSSGTAGLHLALLALGIQEDDEVILPSFTFVAAANAIRYVGAVPVFADIDSVTLNLSPAAVASVITPRTRAIMVVHTFGVPADMDALLALAAQYGLRVIEDACEAIGAEYRGRKVGSLGDVGVFSFYPNKPITTGEGGIVVTRDQRLATSIRALRNQGRTETDDWLTHSLLGYNYRLPEINCALGTAQLSRIESILERRAAIAAQYHAELRGFAGVTLPPYRIEGRRISWFAFVVRLAESHLACSRDRLTRRMGLRGIACGHYFPAIHRMPLYAAFASDPENLSVTDRIDGHTVALPFFNALTAEQVNEVCECLKSEMASIGAA